MANPTAGEVAAKFRQIADLLDKTPETIVPRPYIGFSCDSKEMFVRTSRLMPRPLTKKIDFPDTSYADFCITNETDAVHLYCKVPQSMTCTLITPARPAVYDCEPILSLEEEEEVIA